MSILNQNMIRILGRSLQKTNLFSKPNFSSAYKSDISLDKLYPNSTLKLTTVTQPPNTNEKFSGFIPIDQLEITYSRSSGPGGQNVNKINTKVDVRFRLESANWIHPDIRTKLLDKLKSKVTKEGYVLFKSDLTRSQQLNLADCLQKIRTVIRSADQDEHVETPQTAEKIRRKIEHAARERLMLKRERSQVKRDRQGPSVQDMY